MARTMAKSTTRASKAKPDAPSRLDMWRGQIKRAKAKRDLLIPQWQLNVDYRRGLPFEGVSDEDRIAVNVDWSLTKAKQARLFSQVPQVILEPKHPSLASAVPVFSKVLNDTPTTAKVGVAIDECLPDCINAAGVGAVIVSYESLTDTVQMPVPDLSTIPPDQVQQLIASGQVPMKEVERVRDKRFTVQRIDPTRFLSPVEFTGSDFDDANWLGRSDRLKTADAQNLFKLFDEQVEEATDNKNPVINPLNRDANMTQGSDTDYIGFDEIFYKRHAYHADEKSYCSFHHLVFVNGIDDPVIDEPWKGQKLDPKGGYLGARKTPIRVLTLTYISGQAIPPSDSAIGRPQVDEIIKARSQMTLQRENSLPLRWYDVLRVDPAILDSIQRGTYEGMIPMMGNGAQAIGEVARANYPREDFDFQRVAQSDLQASWSLGPNQSGNFASGARSASEANIIEQATQTEMGYQRARVSAFFVGIAEVMAGLVALYGDFDVPEVGQDGQQRLAAWDRTTINQGMVFSILADSTVLLDASQRMTRIGQFYNIAGPSGFVDVQPILREMASLATLDPDLVIRAPQPRPPNQSNISLRLTGIQDLLNPLSLAMLIQTGQAPTPESLVEAKKMLDALVNTPAPVMAGAPPPPAPPAPMVPPNGPDLTPVGSIPKFETAPRVDRRRLGN